jgi:hypothetical protein
MKNLTRALVLVVALMVIVVSVTVAGQATAYR